MKMKSVMTHAFSQIPNVSLERSKFDRSHGYKTTFNSGDLVPIYVDEALPGDTFNLSMTAFARMATPLKPIMDNLYLDTFFFAVPVRLVWDNWKKFNGEQVNPGDSTDYALPYMDSTAVTGYLVGSIYDYMGIPTGVPGLRHTCLPMRCYNKIYNDFFRDQNLINSITIATGDGPDLPTTCALRKRGKRHDYFTSCLPWPQKGTAVTLPLGTIAPVISTDTDVKIYNTADATKRAIQLNITTGVMATGVAPSGTGNIRFDTTNTGLKADLTNATAATINSLRQAFQIQRMLERDARGGSRYIEIIRSHFGVTSPDARMQRPEYLGGGSTPININPVVQNSNTAAGTTPQGNLAGIGTIHVRNGFSKSFTEHCYILGIINVRADLTYQQGLDRMWSRSSRYDFYWPSLSHLGEQAVLTKEIYAQGSAAPNDDASVFGYQERYAEYRYKPSKITGKFRSTAAGTLDMWHMSQLFAAKPTLGQTFIEEALPMSRVMAVNTEPEFLLDSFFDLKCVRPMPVYSVPGLIDHL